MTIHGVRATAAPRGEARCVLQLKNATPLVAHIAVLPDEKGVDTLFVVVKATWALGARPALAAEQVPVTLADVYWGEPGASSLKYASEMHLAKRSTDVILVGAAWAPAGRPAPTVDVELSIAERKKTVRVFGDREWKNGIAGFSSTSPKPFESMPLVYERAFGGVFVDPASGKVFAEERNPVGVGFAGPRKDAELAGTPLPNIEDPAMPFRGPRELPAPAGFGFIAPSWLPRRAYAGTYDEAWQKGVAPYLPKDFDPRYFNAASPDLVFDRYLAGGEPVQVTNASRRGNLRFTVPAVAPTVEVTVAGAAQKPPVHLETVLIEPDFDRSCLTWRAAVPCDKQALKVESIVVDAVGLAAAERAS